jgi:hypothetical protein
MKVRKGDDTEFYGVDVWGCFLSLSLSLSHGNCFLEVCVQARVCIGAPPPSQLGNFLTLIQKCHIQIVNSSPYLGHTQTG